MVQRRPHEAVESRFHNRIQRNLEIRIARSEATNLDIFLGIASASRISNQTSKTSHPLKSQMCAKIIRELKTIMR